VRQTAALVCTLSLCWAAAAAQAAPVRVPDLIGLTLFGSDAHNAPGQDVHETSPDGRHVAVVVQTGNLGRNTVDYQLLVFPAAQLPTTPHPDTVIALASSSNEPAISHVRWLSDNRTLAFLGGPPGAGPQVHTVDISTRTLTARTHSATGVVWFEVAASGDPLVYQERGVVDTSDYATLRAHGFVVSRGVLPSDVIAGDWRAATRRGQIAQGYRMVRGGRDAPLGLPDSTSGYRQCTLDPWYGPPLSPAGDAILLVCAPSSPPALWRAYRNPRYRLFADRFGARGDELVLLELASGRTRLVYDAPLLPQAETNFAWAPDGRSLLVSDALLPLTGPDSARRSTQRVAAEIDLHTGAISVVVPRDSLIVRSWDAHTGIAEFAQAPAWFEANDATPRVLYRKTARGWGAVSAGAVAPRLVFVVTQDANTPPRLATLDSRARVTRVVFDPNPGLLERRRFGRADVFHWTSKAGRMFAGGLYYPLDYGSGRRYPLVLQTHGYDSTAFAPEGVVTTGNAAQAVAAAGILVLQAADEVKGSAAGVADTPDEGPFDQDMLEGAIDALDQRGLIDRTKVGLQGFSRTCYTGLYFLTHSSYSIAAADLSDGVDYSYVQYIVYGGGTSAERINGGSPWGSSHVQWLERAPGFRLDRVTTPLRLTAIGPHSVLQEWEPYAGLLAQGKPAELVYIPDGSHILVKPWERMTSQQGVVDWWRFWLQGYEDPDPAKAEQYGRWRKLAAQRDSSTLSTSR
jgi:hypothetical protein